MKKLIISMIAVAAMVSASYAQHTLQLDNGPGKLGILDASTLPVGTTILTWPTTGGTILTQTGGSTIINGVTLNWPAANAAGVLTNDGAGNLSWGAGGGGGTVTGTGSNGLVAFWTSASGLSSNANFTYNGTTLGVGNNSGAAAALTVSNAATPGVALALTAGLMTVSRATVAMPGGAGAGNITIPNNAVFCIITDNGVTGGDKTIVYPSGVDGQILIILNNDTNQKAKVGGGAFGADLDTAAHEIGMFIYYSGVWHRVD